MEPSARNAKFIFGEGKSLSLHLKLSSSLLSSVLKLLASTGCFPASTSLHSLTMVIMALSVIITPLLTEALTDIRQRMGWNYQGLDYCPVHSSPPHDHQVRHEAAAHRATVAHSTLRAASTLCSNHVSLSLDSVVVGWKAVLLATLKLPHAYHCFGFQDDLKRMPFYKAFHKKLPRPLPRLPLSKSAQVLSLLPSDNGLPIATLSLRRSRPFSNSTWELAGGVAHHTACKFIRVSGSELVQKRIAIGSSHGESGSGGGDSEVQRTTLELSNRLDGFYTKKLILGKFKKESGIDLGGDRLAI
ncbi:hypothetical protein BT96DRAFT_1009955 [Gymnopus androsaceus JB14]|uniref:Uncharacterized protein n=1 Tax=Gymnopus androsaceus JB14 TaxID=1447944 RepID=A0A6A4GBI8_9AGAR|nr:hypothetical protein BT96DRAFT_1009955 [Gymnopus androsaceus JB14]